MAINVKGRVKIVEGKAYVHPLTLPEIEFLLTLLAESNWKGTEITKVLHVTKKLQSEYKLIKEHSKE
jgi:hypothetical protein